jgi:hypothetical protein
VRGDRSSPAPAGDAREHSPIGGDAGAGRERSPSRERSRSPEQRERSRSASRD